MRNLCKVVSKIMVVLCLFRVIVGSFCFYDWWDFSKLVNEVLLLFCVKDIESYKLFWFFIGVIGE